MTTKRLLLSALVALLLVGIVLEVAVPASHRYRADSMVVARPYTNAFFARSFESHIVRTIPGVLALRVVPVMSAIQGPGVPVITNGVGIGIIALGSTPEDAQRAANEAATRLCGTALTNYGVTVEFVDRATSARRYSYFHDTIEPAVARLFKH